MEDDEDSHLPQREIVLQPIVSEQLDTAEAYEVAPGSERDRSRCSKG